jgi:hypothetical protein
LAEHFRNPGHPWGCWALDLLLRKSAADRPNRRRGIRARRSRVLNGPARYSPL